MPTILVQRALLFKALKKEYLDEDFDKLCFEFGLELDEVVTEKIIIQNNNQGGIEIEKEEVMYKIEIPANRCDLLCLEGLSRALRVFLGKEKPPVFKTIQGKEKVIVLQETAEVRPYIVAAILKDISFTPESYASFIDLQDKLHQNICRQRTLVAIGTHDYDTIQGPLTYEALPPKEINFIPLNQSKEMNGNELMEFYQNDTKMKKYLPIIMTKSRYPVIYDKNRIVLSLPPIINSDHSKIRLTTKNVFIECTATDLTKAQIVLNTIVAMFSQYCKEPFTAETVTVVYPNEATHVYPNLNNRSMEADVDYISKRLGVPLKVDEVMQLLEKMYLSCEKIEKNTISVNIPPTRSDILHPCDIMEDAAISYGFNNLPTKLPSTNTIGHPFPLNKISDALRLEVAQAGYMEALTLSLCSHQENFEFMNKIDRGDEATKIANPKTLEYQVGRTMLIPGLMKTISCNKKMPLPIKVFEVSDVILKDSSKDVGARNERHLCAIYCSLTSGFEFIHGLLDRIMQVLDVKFVQIGEKNGYYIKPSEEPSYFPDRRADIYVHDKKIGSFGILHPEVIKSFDLSYPCSALEINVEHFL